MEKMTNVKALAAAIEALAADQKQAEVVEKLEAIKASMEKKATYKKSAADQAKADKVDAAVLAALENAEGAVTVTELMQGADFSEVEEVVTNQRVSASLKRLMAAGKAVKTKDKKKALFAVA